MTDIIVLTKETGKRGQPVSVHPRVTSYPNRDKDFISFAEVETRRIGDRLVTPLEDIQIKFVYPLSNDVTLSFHHAGGFTLSTFWGAVYEGYGRLYQEEDNLPGGLAYLPMDELFLEGFEEVSPGVFNLAIGS